MTGFAIRGQCLSSHLLIGNLQRDADAVIDAEMIDADVFCAVGVIAITNAGREAGTAVQGTAQ